MSEISTKDIYALRFQQMTEFRMKMWGVLCADYFQQWVPREGSVLEVAAGYCEFINNIQAREKIAVDINRDTRQRAGKDVKVYIGKSSKLNFLKSNSIDRVFISNFLEHIEKSEIVKTFSEVFRVLKPGGKILILQPNIRYTGKDYWMFFDHITPLDDRALVEVLRLTGFEVEKCIPRFLPFTTQSSLPKSLLLLKIYLKIPLAWRILGGQAFVVAVKKP